MYKARLENSRGASITLTGREAEYQIIKIIGLNPPSAHLNMSSVAGLDGSMYNSGRLNNRNIVITLRINGSVEDNRQNLYKFCQTKEKVRFYYRNQNRDVYIDGYVESVECDLFSDSEKAQISIICPQPYFMDTEETQVDGSSVTALFTFPFTIEEDDPIPISEYVIDNTIDLYNDAESEVGCLIDIDVNADISSILIQNTGTGESFTLNGTFLAGDHITISTVKGQKSVTLTRDGVRSNIFSAMQKGSTFFQLSAGDNFFSYLVDGSVSGNADIDIWFTFFKMYRGV